MYNILPTPVNLFKWKIKEKKLCYYCNKPGTIIHVFFNEKIFTDFETLLKYYYVTPFVKNLNSHPFVLYMVFMTQKKNVTDIDLIIHYALFAIYKASVGNQFNKNVVTRIISKYILFMLKYKIEVEEYKTKTTDLNIIKWKKTITNLKSAIK